MKNERLQRSMFGFAFMEIAIRTFVVAPAIVGNG
jgi:hypothetical protein